MTLMIQMVLTTKIRGIVLLQGRVPKAKLLDLAHGLCPRYDLPKEEMMAGQGHPDSD